MRTILSDRHIGPRTLHAGIALAAFIACTSSAGAISASTAKVCDVREYGARGDGIVVDTDAIQHAIDVCAGSSGGGIVQLKSGTFLSGPLRLPSHVRFDIEGGATLLAKHSVLNADQPGNRALLTAKNQEDVGITGSGVVDGNVHPSDTEEKELPSALEFSNVRGGRIDGVVFKNTGPVWIQSSREVEIRNAHVESPLADDLEAVRLSSSHLVRVDHLTTSVGKAGLVVSDLDTQPSEAEREQTEDLTVTDCTFLNGNGLVIGDGVQNLHAKRLRFVGTSHGIFLQANSGSIGDVTFSGVQMVGVKEPIAVLATTSEGSAQLSIEDLKAVGATSAGRITAAPGASVVANLSKLDIASDKGLWVANAQGTFDEVNVAAKEGQGVTLDPSARIDRK